MDIGSAVGREQGITDEQILELSSYRESTAFSELEKQVLDYATALSRTPADVDDELVEELRKSFSDEQMVELTTSIAWENFRARFNRGFNVGSQGFSEGACCVFPEQG